EEACAGEGAQHGRYGTEEHGQALARLVEATEERDRGGLGGPGPARVGLRLDVLPGVDPVGHDAGVSAEVLDERAPRVRRDGEARPDLLERGSHGRVGRLEGA